MPPSHSPGDDYFNDLVQQPRDLSAERQDDEQRGSQDDTPNGKVPKPKRIACVLCRKRKLKCDGNKPSCATCARLQHDCSYDEVRRKSGPKRGYVKALEARLAQVETLLKTQDDPPAGGRKESTVNAQQGDAMVPEFPDISVGTSNVDVLPHIERTVNRHDGPQQAQYPHSLLGAVGTGDATIPAEEPFPWEMIGLGLDEPLPMQDVVDELNQAYFTKIHPSVPMVHRPRYYAAMNLAPHMRPPVCLRYAMWCNAAAVTDKYEALQEHFYHRARKYIHQDEMKGHGESMITVAHCQTWILLATYEFKLMYFPRAWMSSGRASRHGQMMGLHRLDGSGLDVKQCLPPPKDWTEREERRRTFWSAFNVDRYASIGTGWPTTIDERDISTNLPTDDLSFELSRAGKSISLEEALDISGTPNISSYAGVAMMACLFGRNLTHLHRPGPGENDSDSDLNGEFWKRHRSMDNVLLNTAMSLPDQLRLPNGLNNPNTVFLNMSIHTSTICLHQAAIFKADKNRMPARISAESKVRCISAAAEIANVMRQVSHLDLSTMHPYISFCLYVAARVFVQYLKSRPKDEQVRTSLQFLLLAMHAIKRKNPLTESFLVQLDVDLEGSGLDDLRALLASASLTNAANKCGGCPIEEFLGMAPVNERKQDLPAYGNQGLGMNNEQNKNTTSFVNTPASNSNSNQSNQNDPFGYSAAEISEFMSGTSPFELPTRQRSASISMQGSGLATYRSPQSAGGSGGGAEMDLSPEGSGDHLTPGSASQNNGSSSHTSNTGYSPPNNMQLPTDLHKQQQTNNMLGGMYPPTSTVNDTTGFTPDFDLGDPTFSSTASAQQRGFIYPQVWDTTSGRITPGIDSNGNGIPHGPGSGSAQMGISPGPNAMGEMMGMTDADWGQMMDAFPDWDGGLGRHGLY